MWCQLKEMVLFGEHLSNKVVILPIHYSSINWCYSYIWKQQLSPPQPLIAAATPIPLPCWSSLLWILADTNPGNTKLLVLRLIIFLIHWIFQRHKLCPCHKGEGCTEWERGEGSRREGPVPLAAVLTRVEITCRTWLRLWLSTGKLGSIPIKTEGRNACRIMVLRERKGKLPVIKMERSCWWRLGCCWVGWKLS